MKLIKRAAKFVIAEASKAILSAGFTKIGDHIGDAIGNLAAKKIDPKHGDPVEKPDKSEEKEKCDKILID